MERYSKHLEQLVNERTAELEVEKEKATDLLYSESSNTATVEPHQFELRGHLHN